MPDTTSIEWTATHLPDGTVLPGYTFNPWTGCTKVSPGCDHCYADRWSKRSGHVQWGPHGERRRTSPANWKLPLKWNAQAQASGIRRKVFCASLADVFDNHASIQQEWRDDLWTLIYRTPHLDWLMLTKRPQNISRFMPPSVENGGVWPNVWLGTTVKNQTEADRRIPLLLKTPAAVRFLSVEPLLGPVSLLAINTMEFAGAESIAPLSGYAHDWFDETVAKIPRINWLICGGESGPGARPMHIDWARALRDQCQSAGVAFFFKQWGEWGPDTGPLPGGDPIMEGKVCTARYHNGSWYHAPTGYDFRFDQPHDDSELMYRLGKSRAGRLLDDREWNEMPGAQND